MSTLVALFLLTPHLGGPEHKRDEALQGTWLIVGMEYSGREIPPEIVRSKVRVFTFQGARFRHECLGEVRAVADFTADPTQKPKRLELVMTTGPDKGRRFTKTYEIDGNKLRLRLEPHQALIFTAQRITPEELAALLAKAKQKP